MDYDWDWGVLVREPYLDWLVSGFGWTVAVSLCAWVLAFSLGAVVGILRTTDSRPLRAIATGYVELFGNIPLLVHMKWASPGVLPTA